MSAVDGDNESAGFADDSSWDRNKSMTNEEQHLSKQDYVVSKKAEAMDSTDVSDIQDNRPGGNTHKWRAFNQQSWNHPSNYGNNRNGPRFAWGMGYGPNGPYNKNRPGDNKVVRYLMGCGVPREQLLNLHRDFLELIDPEHCGVCNMNLESYQTSRAHYLSKGHLKKQSKWKPQQSEVGHRHAKQEQPLKPRDVYCELCNVQITSKIHADSHYAGKAHRAIVEGRKQTKCSHLLNNRYRYDLLINREKECLPAAKEEQVVISKPIQRELFCNICKTSVTCTDQMTSHLNGKRHLAKEKQYILRMMKGETKDKLDRAEDTSKDNIAGNQEEHVAADVDDWGDGSGTWDDPQ